MPILDEDKQLQREIKRELSERITYEVNKEVTRRECERAQAKRECSRKRREALTNIVKDVGVIYAVFATVCVVAVALFLLIGLCHFSNFWDGVLYTIFMVATLNYWIR